MEKLIEFNKIINYLKNIEVKIDDEDKAMHLLSSISKSLEHLKDSLIKVERFEG